MKGAWGYIKGALVLQLKAMPILLLSPAIGAVRGALVTTWKAIEKRDAAMAAFREQYWRELDEARDEKRDQRSSNATTAAH